MAQPHLKHFMKLDKQPLNALDPSTMIALGVGHSDLLTKSRTKGFASRADLAPPTMRPGCEQADACPSRVGGELHYKDGKVVKL